MNPAFQSDSIHRHPWAFSALVVGAVSAVDSAAIATADLLSVDLSVITIGILSGALLSGLGAVVINPLGLWRQLALIGAPVRRRSLLWFLPFAVYGVLPLTQAHDVSAGRAAGAVLFGVLIASWKLMVLGLLLDAWLPRGARAAAAVTALFWAVMHVGGILTGGIVAPTLVLSLSYLFLAFGFVAVRLRTGLLWPVLVCYVLLLTTAAAVQDSEASNLVASVSDLMPAVTVSLLLAAYGLVLWRRPAAAEDAVDHAGQGSERRGQESFEHAGKR